VFVAGGGVAAAAETDQIQSWLAQLDDEEFARREAATARLREAGDASIEALAAGAVSSSPEAAWRAGEALKQIALNGNEQTIDRVAAALERVGKTSRGGMHQVVAEIRARQRQLRNDRAALQIRQLGGGLSGGFGEGSPAGFIIGAPVFLEAVDAGPEVIEKAEVADVEVAVDVLPAAEAPRAAAEEPLPLPEKAVLEEVVADLFPAEEAAAAEAPLHIPLLIEEEEEVLGGIGGGLMAVDVAVGFGLGGDIDESGLQQAQSLSLGPEWRGGDKGLAALRDLPDITTLAIGRAKLTDDALTHIAALPKLRSISIQGTKFSAAALRKLHRARPNAYMFCQGEAMVGIHADTTGSCVLTSVYPGSGAFDAGLRAGDKIVAIDDLEIRDFSELTISVYARGIGEKLKMEFERDGKRQTAHVELRARKVLEP
jgi:hypothetical protein